MPMPPDGPPMMMGGHGGPFGEKGGPFRDKMKAVAADVLRKEAGLDDAALKRVEAVHDKFDDERKSLHQKLGDHRRALADLAAANSPDDKAWKAALDGMVGAFRALHDQKAREMDELRKVLTPQQAGRVLLALEKVHHAMRQEMRSAKKAWLKQQLDEMADDEPGPPPPPAPPARPGKRGK
jgi:Spy/CpxP family protein refolding chaperone